jgi:predicted outer membrane repeat protein
MTKHKRAIKRTIELLFVSILLSVLFMSVPAQPAQAATWIVTNTNNSGTGSLRQAVLNASSGDIITFSPAVAGHTITLTPEITLDKDLTIDGSGLDHQVAIIGGGSVRVFYVDSSATVSMDRLYLGNSHATSGGIIYNDGDLTVTNSTFAGGEASGHGGAIFNSGTLTIYSCTFTGNIAGDNGGALYSDADSVSVVTNSTFWDNTAWHGGGIYTYLTGLMTVNNSTFSGNSSTSSFPEGAAIYNDGVLRLINSILTANPGGADCVTTPGSMLSSHNLISDGTCSPYLTLSVYLSPLADNGGPTKTMAIGESSSARNNGNPDYCASADQRGVGRPTVCDIGAYEFKELLVVDSLDDPGDGICDIDECTLRDAVATIENGYWISFNSSLSGGTITLGSEIEITKEMTIDGSGLVPNVQVSGGDAVRVFNISSGAMVELDHLDIIHGGGVVFGGGINNDGTLAVSNCNLSGNSVTNVGGGIYNNGTLTVTDSTFSNNSAQGPVIGNGAGIYNYYALSVSGSTFTGNSAYYGGGIYDTGVSTTTISNSTFYDNSATTEDGGGAYFSGTITVSISNTTFSGNSAADDGGGIYKTSGAILHMMNSILAGSTNGGDCHFSGGTFATNTNNLIEDNTCSPALRGDPILGLLADNGGPTETMALGTGSPAIDAGDDATCEAADQRGWSRPIDGDIDGIANCDIGAYEKTIDLFLPLIMR